MYTIELRHAQKNYIQSRNPKSGRKVFWLYLKIDEWVADPSARNILEPRVRIPGLSSIQRVEINTIFVIGK